MKGLLTTLISEICAHPYRSITPTASSLESTEQDQASSSTYDTDTAGRLMFVAVMLHKYVQHKVRGVQRSLTTISHRVQNCQRADTVMHLDFASPCYHLLVDTHPHEFFKNFPPRGREQISPVQKQSTFSLPRSSRPYIYSPSVHIHPSHPSIPNSPHTHSVQAARAETMQKATPMVAVVRAQPTTFNTVLRAVDVYPFHTSSGDCDVGSTQQMIGKHEPPVDSRASSAVINSRVSMGKS